MANLKSLNEIFNNTLYRIPDYQRGYAWTVNQLKDFWDDLYNLNPTKNHYTGVITVKSIPEKIASSQKWNEEHWLLKEKGYKAYYVVDGQQRLTTSIIFIQAIVEVIQNLPDNKLSRDQDVYLGSFSLKEIKDAFLVLSKPPQNIIKTYKFGYETDNPSFKFLRHRIFNEENSGSVNETFYTLNLENAKAFFLEKIEGVYKEEHVAGVFDLYKKLTINFKFNLYEIEEDFDVFVAFETMNNRGKKLSNLELLKNRLIYLTTLYEPNELQEDDRISLRDKIDDAWKEIYYQLGRNKNHPLNDDEFLVAHWIMYFQYSREKGDDYINFLLNDQFNPKNIYSKKEIPTANIQEIEVLTENNQEEEEELIEEEVFIQINSKLRPKDIEEYVNSLKSAAVHWYHTHNPVNNPDLQADEQKWIDKLNRIGIAYFRPLVTASFINESISSSDRVRLFKEIERFIFVAFRLSRALSTYRNSEFYRASRFLREGTLDIDGIIDSLRARILYTFYQPNEQIYFDYGFFQKYIFKHFQNGGGFYWWNGLRYFLYEYEMSLVEQRGSQKIDWNPFIKNEGDKVSIEHILPQTPNKECWSTIFNKFPEEQLLKLQNTIGNLLPLSSSINSSLQNDCFKDKKKAKLDDKGLKIREGYNNGSHSEIEVSQSSEWKEKDILKRGLKLLDFMEKRWDLKFESEEVKIELLGLDFLK